MTNLINNNDMPNYGLPTLEVILEYNNIGTQW